MDINEIKQVPIVDFLYILGIDIEQFDRVVASGSRSKAGESMPGNALFLEEVRY